MLQYLPDHNFICLIFKTAVVSCILEQFSAVSERESFHFNVYVTLQGHVNYLCKAQLWVHTICLNGST